MANPLIRLGLKAAVKGGKALRKKIKTKRNSMNSTDNMTKGPIDARLKGISKRNTGGDGYKVPDTFSRPKAGSKGTLRETPAEKTLRRKASDKELGLKRGKGKTGKLGDTGRTYAKPKKGGQQRF